MKYVYQLIDNVMIYAGISDKSFRVENDLTLQYNG